MEEFIHSLTVADYVVVGIFLLFIAICGIRGFMKSIGGIFVTVCSIIVATVFANPVAGLLKAHTGLFTWLTEKITFGANVNLITGNASVSSMTAETISNSLSNSGFPKIFNDNVLSNIANAKYPDVSTLGGYVDCSLADIIVIVISFIGLLIITAIIATLIKILLVKLAETTVLKYVDILLGMGFGAVVALIVIYVICMILPALSLIINNPGYTTFVNGLSTSPIASIFYNDNILARLIGSIIKI